MFYLYDIDHLDVFCLYTIVIEVADKLQACVLGGFPVDHCFGVEGEFLSLLLLLAHLHYPIGELEEVEQLLVFSTGCVLHGEVVSVDGFLLCYIAEHVHIVHQL